MTTTADLPVPFADLIDDLDTIRSHYARLPGASLAVAAVSTTMALAAMHGMRLGRQNREELTARYAASLIPQQRDYRSA